MTMHDELVVHAIMTKEFADRAGVRGYADIVAKKPAFRLAINTTGNLQSTLGMYALTFGAHGVNDAELAKWGVTLFRGNTNEGLNQLRDGKVDMLINGAFLPTAAVVDINRSRPLLWVEAEEAKLKPAVGKYGYRVVKLPKGAYPFVERDTFMTVNWNAGLAGNHVSEETVYKFLKAITDAKDRVQKVHPSLAKFAVETIFKNSTPLPYHPGAARFYKEKGVLK
jgi:TRAP transporter TAXI family solute receptor